MTQAVQAKQAFFRRLRVARLDSAGLTPAGAENAYVTDAVVKLEVKPNKRAGKEIEKERGDGGLCLALRQQDIIKRYDITLEICDPDPELSELIAGGFVIRPTSSTATFGYKAPRLNAVASPNGISLEGWADAVDAYGSPIVGTPYFQYALPKIFLTPSDFQLDADALPTLFEGYALENPNWGNGPFNDWAGGTADSAWQRILTNAMPASQLGYIATPTQV